MYTFDFYTERFSQRVSRSRNILTEDTKVTEAGVGIRGNLLFCVLCELC